MGHLDDRIMNHVNTAIAISFGLGTPRQDAEARTFLQNLDPSVGSRPAAVAANELHALQSSEWNASGTSDPAPPFPKVK